MDFYRSLGNLILGTRLKRLSEYYISEINKVYQQQGIDFDASWFPIFFLLMKHQKLSILEISQQQAVSHSAASQLVSNLKKKGLLISSASGQDKRVQEISLSDLGKELLEKIKPIWNSISSTLSSVENESKDLRYFLHNLDQLEEIFQKKNLSERILESTDENTLKPMNSQNCNL